MPTPVGYQSMKAIVQFPVGPAADWQLKNPILPMAVMSYESDTGIIKIGDGVTPYNSLAVAIDEVLTPFQKALLDNAGLANGVVVLDENGKVPLSALPEQLHGAVVYVQTITERDALDAFNRTGLVFVVDATADATVDVGSAIYAWGANVSGGPEAWVKIAEVESLDVSLVNFFDKTVNTLDDIQDGVNFVRMSVAEQLKLAGIEENADVTDAENVRAAGAVMIGDKILLQGGNVDTIVAYNAALAG